MKKPNSSGQVLLIFVFAMVVILLGIPAYNYFNDSSARHITNSQKKMKGIGVAEEGIHYGTRVLSASTTTWANAVAGTCPSVFTTNGSPTIFTASGDGKFRLVCSSATAYQVQLISTSLSERNGKYIPERALKVLLSRKIMGATLNNSTSIPGALELARVPSVAGTLAVHWGPVILHDGSTWTIPGTMESSRFPRKISRGGLTGNTYTRATSLAVAGTDNQEYWAFASLGLPSFIDATTYASRAAATGLGTMPTSAATSAALTASPASSGYFSVSTDTAIFTAGGSGYSTGNTAAVVYVNGNAEFRNTAIDLKGTSNSGGFYVTGNLTLGDRTSTAGSTGLTLRVPKSASKEYPYSPMDTSWPCSSFIGTSNYCQLSYAISGQSYLPYRGFLYVGGNLTVKTGNTWVINGALRVDGTLTVESGAYLYVLYDDEINSQVLVSDFDLKTDASNEVGPEFVSATDWIDNTTWSPPPSSSSSANSSSSTSSSSSSTPANQAPTVAITSPSNGSSVAAPASFTINATASDTDGTVASVAFYRGGTLIATDTSAPFSAGVSGLTAGTYSLTAIATDNSGATTTSSAVSITVTANQAPTVSITAPANGASYNAPASFTVTATAADSDGTVASVAFYRSGTLIGTATTAPYSASVSGLAAGSYSFTAIATDNSGNTTTSSAVNVTVAANQAPTVSITAPASGATYTAPASFTLTASAADSDGTITSVAFYHAGNLLGTDTTAPYSLSLSGLSAGSYSFTAIATDNSNNTTTSSMVPVTVGANQAPTVSITSPFNGGSFAAPATFTITANAADSDGTVASVAFYRSGTLIATDTSSPFTASVSGLGAGTYSLTAIATDNSNNTTTSSAVSVTVTANQAPSISITSPYGGAQFTEPGDYTITATASDSDGYIMQVAFYANGNLIDIDSSAPYSVIAHQAAGTYSLSAVATDNGGAGTTSQAVSVTVTSAGGTDYCSQGKLYANICAYCETEYANDPDYCADYCAAYPDNCSGIGMYGGAFFGGGSYGYSTF